MPINAQILSLALISAPCDRMALPQPLREALEGNNQRARARGVGVEKGWGRRSVLAFFLAGERQRKNIHFLVLHRNKHICFLLLKTPYSTSQGALGHWATSSSNPSALRDKRGEELPQGYKRCFQKFFRGCVLRGTTLVFSRC